MHGATIKIFLPCSICRICYMNMPFLDYYCNVLAICSFKERLFHCSNALITGMTPLMTAAERTRADVVEYLVTLSEVSNVERIEALELLGASYANDKENYCLQLAYLYLHTAMEMR